MGRDRAQIDLAVAAGTSNTVAALALLERAQIVLAVAAGTSNSLAGDHMRLDQAMLWSSDKSLVYSAS
eukprot:1220744-Amphidinium_carterae.2